MARTLKKETLLSSAVFRKEAGLLYTADFDSVCERYSSLTEGMDGKVFLFSSPGRTEIIGNHTDHNHGKAIGGSVAIDIACAVQPWDKDEILIESHGFSPFSASLKTEEPTEKEYGTSMALLKGVIRGMKDRGYKVGGFFARMQSDILKGAGISSSAAFELLLCEIFNSLFNGDKISFTECAIIGQYAENVYFGKPSGLLDQLTIARGDISMMDFKKAFPDSFAAKWRFNDLWLVIINCGGDHCNLTGEYAAIRQEMNAIAGYFGREVLIDVDKKEFFENAVALRNKFGGRAVLRAIHFFEENERVEKACEYLEKADRENFLKVVNQSGDSSYKLLQNCYPAGDTEQSVPFALAMAERDPAVLARRIHGGGFAGTILTFVGAKDKDAYVQRMQRLFGAENVFPTTIRGAGAIEVKY